MGWRWDLFSHCLNMSTMIKLATIILSTDDSLRDKAVWLDGRRTFTVKDAYKLTKTWDAADRRERWRWLWKIRIQQRVKIFFWLLAHERIPTNVERCRRHLTTDSMCVRCGLEEEGIITH